jgi:hypothetical protein
LKDRSRGVFAGMVNDRFPSRPDIGPELRPLNRLPLIKFNAAANSRVNSFKLSENLRRIHLKF